MGDYIRIDQTYEYALKSINKGSQIQQSVVSANIASLNYIDDMLDRNTKEDANRLIGVIADGINNHEAEQDIMSLSAMVYKGNQRGLNVQVLIDAMNDNGDWLIAEYIKESKAS